MKLATTLITTLAIGITSIITALTLISQTIMVVSAMPMGLLGLGIEQIDITQLSATATSTSTTGPGIDGIKSSRCYWSGVAPFCIGACHEGHQDDDDGAGGSDGSESRGKNKIKMNPIRRSAFGDGARCWTGIKVYCCPSN